MDESISRQAVLDAFNTNIGGLVIGGKENAKSVERYLNGVIEKIKALPPTQTEPNWIPVTEGLPKIKDGHTSKPCLVYCRIGEEGAWDYAYGFAELEENIFGQVGWNCERDDEYHEALGTVLAWMPLPAPYQPKEVTNGNHN